MDSEALIELLRASSRDAFVARMPNLFLLIMTHSTAPDDGGFDTLSHEQEFTGKRRSSPSRQFEVVEVVKSRGNPYPDRISLGRARNCDVAIRDPSISKLHAHFRVREGGGFDLVDLDSQNGTSINDEILATNRPGRVRPGDTLVFGSVTVKLVDAGQLHDLMK